jgi:2-polyprenyl-3-methyl-5-hydroxy-6-metoxy-1,4-benzoquinol methylase
MLLRRISGNPINLYANDLAFDEATRQALLGQGIAVLPGALELCDAPVTFDAITGIHVIEHVLDPPAVFRWIHEHLNPGGVLYFETPDAGAVLRRIFGNNWGHTHFPRHLNLFTKPHLARLASEAGLVVESHRNTTSAPAWNMSIRNSLKMDALTRHRSVFEMFNYTNKLTLGFFTLVDLGLIGVGIPTSTQQLVAVKP